jgi:uncharacterized phage protein gp47/JayE
MPLATLGPTVDANGISAPTYDQILQSLQESMQAIYGTDIYIAPDSQDGQLLALTALAQHDSNQASIAVYRSFSPTYSQGTALSANVKLNGIARKQASFSTALGDVVGQAGTTINGGIVKDDNGNLWNLPDTVTIPAAGTINVQVIAQDPGSLVAAAGAISTIYNPQLGWQSFLSTVDATQGQPIETDATLRTRQRAAASLPAQSPLAGLLAALQDLDGVTEAAVYENDTAIVDANGLAAHSIAAVVNGGTLDDIARTIGQKKTLGAALNGTQAHDYLDPVTGRLYTINWYPLTQVPITVEITLTSISGYNSAIALAIQQSVADFVNALAIGEDVQLNRLYLPAYLNGGSDGQTYKITALTINLAGADIAIAFNAAASLDPTAVAITVV